MIADEGRLPLRNAWQASGRAIANGRTDGMMAAAFARVPQADIFAATGIQFMPINTLYQLLSLVERKSPILPVADRMLMMGDLFGYLCLAGLIAVCVLAWRRSRAAAS